MLIKIYNLNIAIPQVLMGGHLKGKDFPFKVKFLRG